MIADTTAGGKRLYQTTHSPFPCTPTRGKCTVCSFKGQRPGIEPLLGIHSQIHSLIHGTGQGTSAYHSPAGDASQRLKPRTEHRRIPFAQRNTQRKAFVTNTPWSTTPHPDATCM